LEVLGGMVGGDASVVVIDGEEQVRFTPHGSFVGLAAVPYRVCDLTDRCSTATAFISVSDPFPPLASNDIATVAVDHSVDIDLYANDNTVGRVSTQIVRSSAGAVILLDESTGVATYTPPPSFVGNDVFVYELCSVAACQNATVTVVVYAPQTPPVARDDSGTVFASESLQVTVDVLANDNAQAGVELDPASVQLVQAPAVGSVVFDMLTGELAYTAPAGFSGSVNLTYVVADANSQLSNEATVRIDVHPAPPAPVAHPYTVRAAVNVPAQQYLLASNVDPLLTPEQVSLSVVQPPLYGEVHIDPTTGVVVYLAASSPPAGVDSFEYQICNSAGCSSAPVQVQVTQCRELPPVCAPVASPAVLSTKPGLLVQLSLLNYVTDDDQNLDSSTFRLDYAALDPLDADEARFLSALQLGSPAAGDVMFAPSVDNPTGTVAIPYSVRDANGNEVG
jgi:Bacterial Ig domain